MDELREKQRADFVDLMNKRARILMSYFGDIDPIELAHRYNPLPFGLRSGKYGPLA